MLFCGKGLKRKPLWGSGKDETDMGHKIAVISGDGIGPEIVAEAKFKFDEKKKAIIIYTNVEPIAAEESLKGFYLTNGYRPYFEW